MLTFLRVLLVAFLLPLQAFAASPPSAHVQVELIQETETLQPGHPFWVAVHLKIEEGWHVYWKNPGDAGMPLKVEWNLPAGFEAGPLQWPFPEKFTLADMVGFGYHDEVTLLSSIIPPANLDTMSEIPLSATVKWLVCSATTCQPGSAPVSLSAKAQSTIPQINQKAVALFETARAKMPKSQIEAKTVRKNGGVQIEVAKASDSVVGAYFFPEQKDLIDHSVDPTVASDKASKGYLVNLKGGQEIGVKGKTLKGVLVLQTNKGSEAFDIDTPIQEATLMTIGNESAVPANPFGFEGGVGYALLLAFIGGMILNLMPCVLPVLSFKVMSFVQMSGKSRSLTLKHGIAFSFGVLVSFWILATTMLILREYGQAVGWGFQLQEPLFVVILASLLFIFALNLFGVFEWGLVVSSWAGQTQAEKAQKSQGYTSSFLSGGLATAVATPCTGPFLGSAVGFAFTLPIYQSLLIFTSLGLGMCFPYLVLAAFPGCLKFVPKPGRWMEIFKELMGFVMLATVLWLMWVFAAQTDMLSLFCLLAGFLCFAIGAWVYGKGVLTAVTTSKRVLAYAFVALFAVAGCQTILFPRANWYQKETTTHSQNEWKGWETFSPEKVAALREEGKPVLIDFTAKWCLICQANHLVLTADSVDQQLEEAGVVKMKADWTKNDPVIAAELAKLGRNSVPLYVLYGKGENPVILPQVLTPDIVNQYINEALPKDEIALE